MRASTPACGVSEGCNERYTRIEEGPEPAAADDDRHRRVIGAGLFVGSGVVIGDTGPGAFITYGLAGVLIIMVMRMLAEMAVANPSTGSFADYARTALATGQASRSAGCIGISG